MSLGDELSIGSSLVLVKNKINNRHLIGDARVCYGVANLIREQNERIMLVNLVPKYLTIDVPLYQIRLVVDQNIIICFR